MMGLVSAVWKEPPEPADEASYTIDEHGQRRPWPPGPLATCAATVTTAPGSQATVTAPSGGASVSTARSSSATGTVATSTGGVVPLSTCAPDPVT